MSGLLEQNGTTSHKRVINITTTICAVIICLGGTGLAIWKGNDVGTNTVALILGLFGLGTGGAVLSNIVEKK